MGASAPPGMAIHCSQSVLSGPWDTLIVPTSTYFSTPAIRKGRISADVIVHGPAHLFRSSWLAGARDFLREPWAPEELFLRLRGARPSSILWEMSGRPCRLDGRYLTSDSDARIRLSTAEAGVLRVLVQRRGLPVSRAILAWESQCAEGRVVDTLVGRIRAKLARIIGLDTATILSVRGVGYRLP